MKTLRLFSAVLGLLAACALRAADSTNPASRVDVVFDHPENFTDVKDGVPETDRGRDEILGSIRSFLESYVTPQLPAGDRLSITFTDIDLAGDYEPWHGSEWSNVRVVKDIYPPAFKFNYTVTDAAGKVVKSGSENIRDAFFQTRLTIDNSDPLRYEKSVLGDWSHSALRGLK